MRKREKDRDGESECMLTETLHSHFEGTCIVMGNLMVTHKHGLASVSRAYHYIQVVLVFLS